MRIASEIFKIAPTLLLLAFWGYMARGGMGAGSVGGGGGGGRNIFQVGKSKPTVISKEAKTGVSFKDVAGLSEAKVEVMELVDFLKNPDRTLLVSPPDFFKLLASSSSYHPALLTLAPLTSSTVPGLLLASSPRHLRTPRRPSRRIRLASLSPLSPASLTWQIFALIRVNGMLFLQATRNLVPRSPRAPCSSAHRARERLFLRRLQRERRTCRFFPFQALTSLRCARTLCPTAG